ncbi:MAG: rhodanese-like domain-containing protein [Synechococcales cyanobacterium]
MDLAEAVMERIEQARQRVPECSVHRVRQRQLAGDPFWLVDVREDREWQEMRLPGSRHMGRGVLEWVLPGEIPDPDQDIILYCGIGYRSLLAAESLQHLGYTRVSSMAGGIEEWLVAEYPIEVGQ